MTGAGAYFDERLKDPTYRRAYLEERITIAIADALNKAEGHERYRADGFTAQIATMAVMDVLASIPAKGDNG